MSNNAGVAKGALWSIVEKTGQQGVSFLVFMVLARLVGPAEYGLANIVFIYFLLTAIIVSGIVDGVVSLQIEDENTLTSLFWLVFCVGVLLAGFCFVTAWPLAAMLGMPRLVPLLHLFSVVPALLGLSAVPNVLVMKSLNFKLYAIRTFVATVLGGVAGLLLAYREMGAYAIVWQQIVIYSVMNLVIWPSAGWRPRFSFNLQGLMVVMRPGLNLMRVSGLAWIDQQIPRLVIAHFLGPGALGYYAFTLRIRLALQEMLITAPIVVLFPGLSRIRNDRIAQVDMAGKMLAASSVLILPVLSVAAATATIYVPLIFGDKWAPAIPLLQIYLLGAAAMPFVSVCIQLFRANGKLNVLFKANIGATIAGAFLLPLLLLPKGLNLMATGVAMLWLFMVPVYVALVRRHIGLHLGSTIRKVLPFLLSVVLTFTFCTFISTYEKDNYSRVLLLFISVLGGFAVFGIASWFAARSTMMEIMAHVQKLARRGNT